MRARQEWAALVAVVSMVVLGGYFALVLFTTRPEPPEVYGVSMGIVRAVYGASALLAVVAVWWRPIRPWWLVVMSLATIGRASTLVVIGDIGQTRAAEVRGVVLWVLAWLLGVLAVLVLEATRVLRELRP